VQSGLVGDRAAHHGVGAVGRLHGEVAKPTGPGRVEPTSQANLEGMTKWGRWRSAGS